MLGRSVDSIQGKLQKSPSNFPEFEIFSEIANISISHTQTPSWWYFCKFRKYQGHFWSFLFYILIVGGVCTVSVINHSCGPNFPLISQTDESIQ